MGQQPNRLFALAIAAAALFVAAGCTAGKPATGVHESLVRVSERDFRISVQPKRVPAGDVRILVRNKGPVAHEFVVVHTGSSQLPLRADGLTVDEDEIEPETVGILEPGAPGEVRELRLHLPPGRYELICNMSGHYLGGMHADLVVG